MEEYARLIQLVVRRLPNGMYQATQYRPDLTVVGKTAEHSRPSMALAALFLDSAKNIDIIINEDNEQWTKLNPSETEPPISPDTSK